MQFWIDLLTSPTVLIATFVIGALGEAVKRMVNAVRTPPQYDENGNLLPTTLPDGKVITYRDRAGKAVPPPDPTWMRVFDATLPAQPVIVGLLLGCIPWLPAEESLIKVHYEFAGHLATYGAAGILAKVGYDILVTTFRRFIQSGANKIISDIGGTAASTTVATPPDPATDPTPSADSTQLPPSV